MLSEGSHVSPCFRLQKRHATAGQATCMVDPEDLESRRVNAALQQAHCQARPDSLRALLPDSVVGHIEPFQGVVVRQRAAEKNAALCTVHPSEENGDEHKRARAQARKVEEKRVEHSA